MLRGKSTQITGHVSNSEKLNSNIILSIYMFLIILFTDNLSRTVSAILGYLFHANQMLSDITIVRYPLPVTYRYLLLHEVILVLMMFV